MPFRCFASSDTSPVVELVGRDAPVIAGDAFLAFIGAPPYPRLCSKAPSATPFWRLSVPAGLPCTSERA